MRYRFLKGSLGRFIFYSGSLLPRGAFLTSALISRHFYSTAFNHLSNCKEIRMNTLLLSLVYSPVEVMLYAVVKVTELERVVCLSSQAAIDIVL